MQLMINLYMEKKILEICGLTVKPMNSKRLTNKPIQRFLRIKTDILEL